MENPVSSGVLGSRDGGSRGDLIVDETKSRGERGEAQDNKQRAEQSHQSEAVIARITHLSAPVTRRAGTRALEEHSS